MENKTNNLLNKQKLFIISGVLLSIFLIIFTVAMISNRTSQSGRAQTTSGKASISKESSYVFASPITAFADGVSTIRVTVFLLDNQGLGILGQIVKLKTSSSVAVSQNKPTTDNFGRAIFDLTSTTPGNYTIAAEAEGVSLSQTVSISFQ